DQDLHAAKKVWLFFKGLPGIDWVIAGKLLARKRPRLVPVFDSTVKKALTRPPEGFWAALGAALRNERRLATVEALRPAGLTTKVTTLRLLDVAVWMRFSESTNARRARERLGMVVQPRIGRSR